MTVRGNQEWNCDMVQYLKDVLERKAQLIEYTLPTLRLCQNSR